MSAVHRAWLMAGLACCLALGWSGAAVARTNAVTRATSVSRQFTAFAPGGLLPHALCVFAEQVRRQWAAKLDLGENWRDPIVLIVRDREPAEAGLPTPVLRVAKTDLHLRYQLVWLTPPPLDRGRLTSAVVEALCAEFANRHQPVPRDRVYVAAPIPPWLSDGLARALRGRDARLVRLAQRALSGARPAAAMQLLAAPHAPTDPVDRQLFEVNASFLVESLLELPHGRRRLRQFLAECGATKSALKAFWLAYGDQFADDAAVERWWAVQLVNQTTLAPFQTLTIQRSHEIIAGILPTTLTIADERPAAPTERVIPVGELWRHHNAPWFAGKVADKLVMLRAVRRQLSPAAHEALDAYVVALEWLQQKYLNRFRRAVRRADALAAELETRAVAIAAYLDEMESTHGPQLSDASLDNLFQAIEELETLQLRRRSPVSDYLDQFDR